jgi:quinol monooxygenase YgiN
MVHVMARIIFHLASAAAGRDILSKLAVATRREAGCVSYELFQQAGAPQVFQTVEQWSDEAAADAHMTAPHVAAAIAAAAPLLAAPPEILSFTKVT